ncbi:MAG: ATP-binding cassette domain-containing protein, partial [Chitinivibrionales bacterium]|nr:ATP-binding cassette domain-containing protein [Chitinivibrionales bacterium]MBD3356313.1 ATP-binding cassette domain-containing protein [Chitinivibrionales bacterium]
GIQGVLSAVGEITFTVLPSLLYVVLAVMMMARLDWRLTLLVIAFAPLPAVMAALAAPRQINREKTLLDRWASIYSRFNEVLSGIVTVRSFAMEHAEKNKFLKNVSETNGIIARGIRFDSSVGASQNLVILTARVAAIGMGGYLVLKDQITLGTVVAFMGYVGGMFAPVQGLTGVYRTIRMATVSLDQVFSILDTEAHVQDAHDARPVRSVKGRVTFDRVHFAYDQAKPLLNDISLDVRPGEMVAVVGPSGTGKTTLMALLQRFYDPTSGTVSVDGMDVRRLKQHDLRRHIGVVLQDSLLFNESVRDNIAYGRPDASKREIEQAAGTAQAHEFIMRLDKGYDTVVGERGGRLSAGERQRIAIARALLKDPSILILDEATAALDAETEALLQEGIDCIVRGRTTFVIAHRLATVVKADRIVAIRDGRIAEIGTHRELCERRGYYASLVARQTNGLLLTP